SEIYTLSLHDALPIFDACEFFVLYKFFAFPVVDDQRRVIGVVDVSLFAEEILGEREEQSHPAAPVRDDVFEALGFHLEQIRGARSEEHTSELQSLAYL